jgi:hypothetical protein
MRSQPMAGHELSAFPAVVMDRPSSPDRAGGADPFAVQFAHEAEVLTVRLGGALDGPAGATVDARLRDALVVGGPLVRRVEFDLDDVISFTDEGVAALVRCRELMGAIPDGLHYRASSAAGRSVLLATCRTDDALM